jgi:hypothetical protein
MYQRLLTISMVSLIRIIDDMLQQQEEGRRGFVFRTRFVPLTQDIMRNQKMTCLCRVGGIVEYT